MCLLCSLLVSGCRFGRGVQEAFENRPHGRKNKTPLVHSTENDCLLCARHCSKTRGTTVNKADKSLSLCNLHLAGLTDSKRDGGVLVGVADCTLNYFVLGCHLRQGDSLAETARQGIVWCISGRGVIQVEKTEYKDSRVGMGLTSGGPAKRPQKWQEPRKGRGTGLE